MLNGVREAALMLLVLSGTAVAEDNCFVEFHRGFAGEWVRNDIERAAPKGLEITQTRILQRVVWDETGRLISEILPAWNEQPEEVVTQVIAPKSLYQTTVKSGEVSEVAIEDIAATCFEGEGGVQGLVITFEQTIEGQRVEFRNSVEISKDATLLVSTFRAAGSDAPYQWNKTVYAVKRTQ